MPGLVFRSLMGKNNWYTSLYAFSIALLSTFQAYLSLPSSLFKCHWSCCHCKSESSESPLKARLVSMKKRHPHEANTPGLYITDTVARGLLQPHLTAGRSGGLAVYILPGGMRADELVKTKDSPTVSSPVLAIGGPYKKNKNRVSTYHPCLFPTFGLFSAQPVAMSLQWALLPKSHSGRNGELQLPSQIHQDFAVLAARSSGPVHAERVKCFVTAQPWRPGVPEALTLWWAMVMAMISYWKAKLFPKRNVRQPQGESAGCVVFESRASPSRTARLRDGDL